jgi:hypothetical protein
MGLPTWGPKSWIQLRLLKHLNYIKQDDNVINQVFYCQFN